MACLKVRFEKHTAEAAFILNGHSHFDRFTFCDFAMAALERGLYGHRHLLLELCEL